MSLALHLYQSPMENESRLLRMGRSLTAISPPLEIRLVGLQVDQRSGLEPVDERVTVDRIGTASPKHDTLHSRFQKVGGWFLAVFKAYRDQPVAVVSAHSVFALPLAFALGRSTRAPVVYNPHELETRTPSMVGIKRVIAETIERSLVRRCALVTAVNQEIADWYRRRYHLNDVLVVHNYPAASAQRPARDLRSELGIPEDSVLVIHTGNLNPGRNIELILETFEREASHHVVFVGAGELSPIVDAAVARSVHVHHLPPVPPDEVVSVVKGADLALSLIDTTATSYAWSSPNKLFEALAAGVPPVCTDLPEARRRLGPLAEELLLTDPAAQLASLLHGLDRQKTRNFAFQLTPLPTWEEDAGALVEAYSDLLLRR